MKNLLLVPITVFGLILNACGGGGGEVSPPKNKAPTATSVNVTGTNTMGETLTGSYTYADAEDDAEGTSTYQWLRDGAPISEATKLTYNIIGSDANAALSFEVTPVAAAGTADGTAVESIALTIAAISKPLNDTGIITCGDYAYTDTSSANSGHDVAGSGTHNNDLTCSSQATVPTRTSDGYDDDGDIIRASQDVFYGRDFIQNDNGDGHAGFSFTRLDSEGVALTDPYYSYSYIPWDCVRDNVTGLMWETKQTNGSATLRDSSYKYSWYNSTGINDGAAPGTPDNGDVCFDTARCDTQKYVADVNSAGLCGENDWRLPTKQELISISNKGSYAPSIDAKYFPNTENSYYWTSSSSASLNTAAFTVHFNSGYMGSLSKVITTNVRLVRGNQ